MRTCGDEAQAVGGFGVARKRPRTHRRRSPEELLLAEGEGVAFEGVAGVKLDGALAVVSGISGYGGDDRIVRTDAIQVVDELVDRRSLVGAAWVALRLLTVVEEEPSLMCTDGIAGDGAGAAPERAAEVVPPRLAEVEAVVQRRTGNGACAHVG